MTFPPSQSDTGESGVAVKVRVDKCMRPCMQDGYSDDEVPTIDASQSHVSTTKEAYPTISSRMICMHT